MSDTSTDGPRVTGDQVRDLNRLRRPQDGRMIAGVAAGLARQLDVDPTIVRVIFGALTIFGGAGIVLYGIAWLTIPDEGRDDSSASELLKRDPQVVMLVGLILAAVVAGMTMMGTLFWSAPNPWPVMVLAVAAAVGLIIFSRRQEHPLPPPTPPSAASSGARGPDAPPDPDREDTTELGTEATTPLPSGGPGVPGAAPPVPTQPVPPLPPAPRRPRSRLLPITLCVVLVAEGVIWIVDRAGDVDVHPSVYPGTALGIVAAGLLVGAWYGRARLLILFGALASIATLATAVVGDGPHGEQVYVPRTAAAVADHYEHGAGEIEVHLEEVADVENLDGRTIDIDANVGQVTVFIPSTLDASINAEVTGAGEIDGMTDVEHRSHGQVDASQVPVDDNDPDVTIDVTLRFGAIDIRQVVCPPSNESGVIHVPAACN